MEREQTPDHTMTVDPLVLAAELGERLRAHGWQLAAAESCTGGLFGHRITAIAGSSDYFAGGVIAYANGVKERLLGVTPATLQGVGSVSRECALEMARGARRALEADVGVSSTGIAGPGGATPRKPVGLVYIAVSTPEMEDVQELRLEGSRLAIIEAATNAALQMTLTHVTTRNDYP